MKQTFKQLLTVFILEYILQKKKFSVHIAFFLGNVSVVSRMMECGEKR